MRAKATIASKLTVRRGLDEAEAAVYLSLSPSLFRQLVGEGLMPRPRIVGRRRIFDIVELDAAFSDLPREGDGAEGKDSWSDFE